MHRFRLQHDTPFSSPCLPSGFGLAIVLQLVPSHCSINVPVSWPPTAKHRVGGRTRHRAQVSAVDGPDDGRPRRAVPLLDHDASRVIQEVVLVATPDREASGRVGARHRREVEQSSGRSGLGLDTTDHVEAAPAGTRATAIVPKMSATTTGAAARPPILPPIEPILAPSNAAWGWTIRLLEGVTQSEGRHTHRSCANSSKQSDTQPPPSSREDHRVRTLTSASAGSTSHAIGWRSSRRAQRSTARSCSPT